MTTTNNHEWKIRFEIGETANGEQFFRIKARNGRILAHSQPYRDAGSAGHAIRLIEQYAGDAPAGTYDGTFEESTGEWVRSEESGEHHATFGDLIKSLFGG